MTRVEPAMLEAARGTASATAARLRLPLSGRVWRGLTGNWAGAGIGSSIDFQDHRPYLPGDDPRYINWQAFARSGHYTMKLYREEVSPRVDLLLDRSPSMFFDPAKCLRVWELFFFAYESALQAGASVRMYSVNDDELRELPREKIESLTVDIADSGSSEGVPFSSIPWRPGALRIVISDLLFPPRGTAPLAPLAHGNGRGILFVPHARSESDPDWNGNLTLVDCESGARRRQFVSVELMDRYRRNYARHFDQWQAEARRMDVRFARVPAERELIDALQQEAMRTGAVESWA